MTKTEELLRQAREALEEHNSRLKSLADSGDAGFWSAEEQPEYIEAQRVIDEIDAHLPPLTPEDKTLIEYNKWWRENKQALVVHITSYDTGFLVWKALKGVA